MANPIAFKPAPYDPKDGLMKRLEAAPRHHAEALLVAYDLLQEAHDQGILDLLHGMVHAKDRIAEELAHGMRGQESVDALRNVLSLGKLLGAIEPETISCVAEALTSTGRTVNEEPPGLWALFRRATSHEGRRGLGIMVGVLTALGSSPSAKK